MTAALTLQSVTKRFGGLQAVHDVSVAIAERQITGLIGPNGAGKTTLFRVISGAVRPTSGRVLLAEPLRDTVERQRRGHRDRPAPASAAPGPAAATGARRIRAARPARPRGSNRRIKINSTPYASRWKVG